MSYKTLCLRDEGRENVKLISCPPSESYSTWGRLGRVPPVTGFVEIRVILCVRVCMFEIIVL